MKRIHSLSLLFGFALVLVIGCASLLPGRARAEIPTVVMSGLDNPRGMAFGPEGALYVAEAGRGRPISRALTIQPRQAASAQSVL
jgi:hypothetical protein